MKNHKPQRIGKPALPKAANPDRLLKLNSAAWAKLRAKVLERDPLCRHCWDLGLIVMATEVDHRNNDPSDNRLENLQGLCASHHAIKTRQDYGATVKHGCDIHGMPLDPDHPWNRQHAMG